MLLINADTGKLERFNDDRILPPFAILSHTWGDSEVTLQQYQDLFAHGEEDSHLFSTQPGYLKILATRRQAVKDRAFILACAKQDYARMDATSRQAIKKRHTLLYEETETPDPVYVWVDTCCIDKISSADLSEAINSMFRWYSKAQVCYAYLEDFDANLSKRKHTDEQALAKARWFTRGWTLQELIAPRTMRFFDRSWLYDAGCETFGDKRSLGPLLARITGIDLNVLTRARDIDAISIARRMSWAAHRETTKEEDIAYSLLGIFGVNIPLLYGEGAAAFVRLQEEILRNSDDQSLFAWQPEDANTLPLHKQNMKNKAENGILSVFSSHPRNFIATSNIDPYTSWGDPPTVTSRGVRFELPLHKVRIELTGGSLIDRHRIRNRGVHCELYVAPLSCVPATDTSLHPAIVVQHVTQDLFIRHPTAALVYLVRNEDLRDRLQHVYLCKKSVRPKGLRIPLDAHLQRGGNLMTLVKITAYARLDYKDINGGQTQNMSLVSRCGDKMALMFRRRKHQSYQRFGEMGEADNFTASDISASELPTSVLSTPEISTTVPSTPFPFNRLPYDIRTLVYHHLESDSALAPRLDCPGLLLSSRQNKTELEEFARDRFKTIYAKVKDTSGFNVAIQSDQDELKSITVVLPYAAFDNFDATLCIPLRHDMHRHIRRERRATRYAKIRHRASTSPPDARSRRHD
ncbi:hypothetical protein OPT61_g9426 [Boeremia exigua]|uniref:Uncharacterized protein n=1 Tax=Boeremia exigua TaxID=749465 RepID=A0ACC2HUZ5_9PLEO|nr:hypothetical protein OPT61_g9426 [Boeremia exigua]